VLHGRRYRRTGKPELLSETVCNTRLAAIN
jgi:hypothetical protein